MLSLRQGRGEMKRGRTRRQGEGQGSVESPPRREIFAWLTTARSEVTEAPPRVPTRVGSRKKVFSIPQLPM
jgi:hypothetical protein